MPKMNMNSRELRTVIQRTIQDIEDRENATAHAMDNHFVPRRYNELADQLASEETVTLHGARLPMSVSTGFFS